MTNVPREKVYFESQSIILGPDSLGLWQQKEVYGRVKPLTGSRSKTVWKRLRSHIPFERIPEALC
jgi:hypothetical protein